MRISDWSSDVCSSDLALGRRCAFIGQVADDQLGGVFTHDLRALGVSYDTPPLSGGAPTARCLILVTPDGQRTMNTFLGASHLLEQAMIDERSEEHTSELQSLMRISYAVFCLKKKKRKTKQ